MGTVAKSDLFGRVHKGLRKSLFDLAYRAGRTDFTNTDDVDLLKAQAGETLYFLRKHGHIEDTYMLPLVAGKGSDLVEKLTGEHVEIEQQIEDLEAAVARFGEIGSNEERIAAGEAFYFKVNSFIAGYLLHMEEEETVVAPLFFQHCTDAELQQMHQSIIANNSPSDSMLMLKYSIPAIDACERASFLGSIRGSVPPPAFEAIMNLIGSILDAGEHRKLVAALEPSLEPSETTA
jgi:hypothetical protein